MDPTQAPAATPATPDAPPTAEHDAGWRIIPGGNGPHYPHVATHTWGEFAMAAVELGGYRDATLVDPYTGRRLWVAGIASEDATMYDILRALADKAEQVGFLGGKPAPAPEEAPHD